ncbi:MAG: LptF/LptG family permease [Phycisphaerales bacterium]|nr:LptF/LptG family permease [Phycisphaerales bacterium]
MVFKTLHWYISRELLRIFFLTASVLTSLLAFGGTFKEITKRGIDISQLAAIMTNLMPAMLAYTIPIAALFAAVLVYWRLSTDNELTACRASGISFVAIVMPALFLGVVMASTDLLFVNYVVPVFLQRTERAIFSDSGSLLVNQIGRQESFEIGKYILYANSATQLPSPDPDTSIIRLEGMAGFSRSKDGKPDKIGIARRADITIHDAHDEGTQLSARFDDGSALNLKTVQKMSGSLDSQFFDNGIFTLPSLLKSKPKFANLKTLRDYQVDPSLFPPVNEIIEKIKTALYYQRIGERLFEQWKAAATTTTRQGTRPSSPPPVIFSVSGYSTGGIDEIRLYAQDATIDAGQPAPHRETTTASPRVRQGAFHDEEPDASASQRMTYRSLPGGPPVRVDQYSRGTLRSTFTCDQVAVELSTLKFPSTSLGVALQLSGNVKQTNHTLRTVAIVVGPTTLSNIVLPDSIIASAAPGTDKDAKLQYVSQALSNPADSPLYKMGDEARKRQEKLQQTIHSELHSRASFAVACLTLVLLGAALGILMRGRNPLAVFVIGFVPAIILVLLITAGRQVTEGNARNMTTGICLIWAGNAIIVAFIGVVYSKLLRH